MSLDRKLHLKRAHLGFVRQSSLGHAEPTIWEKESPSDEKEFPKLKRNIVSKFLVYDVISDVCILSLSIVECNLSSSSIFSHFSPNFAEFSHFLSLSFHFARNTRSPNANSTRNSENLDQLLALKVIAPKYTSFTNAAIP